MECELFAGVVGHQNKAGAGDAPSMYTQVVYHPQQRWKAQSNRERPDSQSRALQSDWSDSPSPTLRLGKVPACWVLRL